MPSRLTLFLLVLCNYSFAQITGIRSPTKFDRFIDSKKVQWAAYANDILFFDKYNLSDELYKRFQRDEIKISNPINRDSLMTGNKIIYINKKELETRSYPPGLSVEHLQKPTNRVDSNSSENIEVQQILYVKNGKLYSYIPWVTTRISVYTSNDRFLGTTEYFSSGINPAYNSKISKRDKAVPIKTTGRKIMVDHFPRTDMLKQFYGINMLEAIWNSLISDKNELIDLRIGQKISLKNANELIFNSSVQVPVYDSVGNIASTKNHSEPMSAALFPQLELMQDWYYSPKKNTIVSNITGLTLFVRNKNLPADGELIPAIKITFK